MAKSPAADPRLTITADSFTVAPDLIGLPLARPGRRAFAMLIDLFLVAILANAGGVFLAFAAGIALWRASSPAVKGGTIRRGLRGSLRFLAAAVVVITILNVWGDFTDRENRPAGANRDDDAPTVALDWSDLAALPDFIALTTATDTALLRNSARNLADRLASNENNATRRDMVAELLNEVTDPGAREILRSALGGVPASDVTAPSGDSAVLAYADALGRGDSAEIGRVREAARIALAGDRIQRLEDQRDELRTRNRELEGEVDRLEEGGRGFLGFLRGIADDLGIGFGWGALYFTAFLTVWRGQTPGKRAAGVRVIRLDGRPLSWWIAFERFGGYAASLSTGMLGFAQIFWDRNRQGLHDKAVETVVIRDLPPSLASAEGWQPAGR